MPTIVTGFDMATTVPTSYNGGQWYVTTSTTTNFTNVVDYYEIVQADGGRWRIPAEGSWAEPVPATPRRELTPEQQVEQERQRQEIRDRREARERRLQEASEAAKRLLLSLLSPENRQRFEDRRPLKITGSHGGEYDIDLGGLTGNIRRRGGTVPHPRIEADYRGRLCCHPRLSLPEGQLPHYDGIASQVLMIQCDEPGFLSLANRH